MRATVGAAPMAEEERTKTETGPPQGAPARLAQLAWQALPAIAGAISVLGFVALIGGAIEWVRFWSAGLPADQAVRVVPEQELVTIGAVTLVGFSIVGLLAVLLLYLLDRRGNATLRTLRGLFFLATAQMLATLIFIDLPEGVVAAFVVGVGIAALFAYYTLADLPKLLAARRDAERERKLGDDTLREAALDYRAATERYSDALFRAKLSTFPPPNELTPSAADPPGFPGNVERALLVALRQAAVDLVRAKRDWPRAVDRWREAAPDDTDHRDHRRSASNALKRSGPPPDAELEWACGPPGPRVAPVDGDEEEQPTAWQRAKRRARERWDKVVALRSSPRAWTALATALVVVPGTIALWALGGPNQKLLAVMVATVALLTAATFGVAHATSKFAWYGAAAFASLILFGSILSIGRVIINPEVQPVALVRKGDGAALCGVYVTETDKRIYMGRVQKDPDEGDVGADGGAGRMFWVPSEEVDVVTVGPIQKLSDAQKRALELTAEIQADRPVRPPSAEKTYKETIESVEAGPGDDGVTTTTTTARDVPEETDGANAESPSGSNPLKNLRCRTADITEEMIEE